MSIRESICSKLFLLVTFVSAFLLFQIQPLISRLLLPLFGGSSAVWTTCILFFQTVLLLGYVFAFGLDRYFRPKYQQAVYALLLLISLFFVQGLTVHSIRPLESPEAPILDILRTLARTVGFPYLILSATSPLVQTWFRGTFVQRTPYRLYAVSNVGSLMALLSYPILIEPNFGLNSQVSAWFLVYLTYFFTVCLLVVLLPKSKPLVDVPRQQEVQSIRARSIVAWLFFSAISSVLLLGFTHYITFDIAPMPLLWVIPLSLYLLSFIVCFRESTWYKRRLFFPLLAGICFFFSGDFFASSSVPLLFNICFCFGALFICCVICHGELYTLRPKSEKLALFYVAIALGSSIGAIFSAVLAPLIFTRFIEVPIGLLVLLFTYAWVITHSGERIFPHYPVDRKPSEKMLIWAFCSYGVLWFFFHSEDSAAIMYRERNFYGSLKVTDTIKENPKDSYRSLLHGRTIHGLSYLDPVKAKIPVAYYGYGSPLALVFTFAQEAPALNIGVIGLGIGACAAWGRPTDSITFYEINPSVTHVAKQYFNYLRDSAAPVKIVMGDARLSLEHEESKKYDVLILDAFSSDSIPFHLLTIEALRVYLRHLQQDGILAIHITNHHLDLEPIVLSIARNLGLHAGIFTNAQKAHDGLENESKYAILSRSNAFFTIESTILRAKQLTGAELQSPIWTDDFASTLSVIRWSSAFSTLFEKYFNDSSAASRTSTSELELPAAK